MALVGGCGGPVERPKIEAEFTLPGSCENVWSAEIGAVEWPKIETEFTLPGSFDNVWSALIKTLSEENYPIKAIEKDSGVVTSDWMSLPRTTTKAFKRLAMTPDNSIFVYWATARCTVSLYVSEISQTSTRVRINLHAEAYEDYPSRQWRQCYSTGKKESELFSMIYDNLQGLTARTRRTD